MHRVARLPRSTRAGPSTRSTAKSLSSYASRPSIAPTASSSLNTCPTHVQARSFFSLFRKTPKPVFTQPPAPPLLSQNDLFHPLSQSPFPALVDKANRIKSVSLCPTSFEKHQERIRPAYDCPDCGWPTHASRERWEEGKEEHKEYCGRLREVNEDEHDIRSGRKMNEFENMPGA
jgi:splicing suppressor protein 51